MDNIINLWEKRHENVAVWRDFIKETTQLSEEHVEYAANFLTELANRELPFNNQEGFVSFVPLNLQIISKIKDFSKIIFVNDPITTLKTITVNVGQDEVQNLGFLGLNLITLFESVLVNEIANQVNENINNGKTVRVYSFVESIRIMAEGATMPTLTCVSRIEFI